MQRVNRIAAGILREGDRVLLVQQQGVEDPAPSWSFPGGMAADGETLPEALRREILEETGLVLRQTGKLAYLTQMDNLIEDTRSFAFVFEISDWSGDLQGDDPDGLILQAVFLPIADAVRRLDELPWLAMHEPAIAYLTGKAPPGTVWYYRLDESGAENRIEPSQPAG